MKLKWNETAIIYIYISPLDIFQLPLCPLETLSERAVLGLFLFIKDINLWIIAYKILSPHLGLKNGGYEENYMQHLDQNTTNTKGQLQIPFQGEKS
jgi:hypothetical protein